MRFRWRRFTFGAGRSFSDTLVGAQLTSRILRTASSLLLASIALVAIPELIVSNVHIGYPSWLPLASKAARFDQSLAIAVGVGGTLLGLYFATIGIVVSTAYSDAPDSVRLLFLRDRANRLYIKSVTLLVLAGLWILGLNLIHIETHTATSLILALLAGFAVVSLVQAGNEAFNFFNPAALAYPITRDFSAVVRRAACGGPRWRDPSFQSSYQRTADDLLTTYGSLAAFTVRRGADERRLAHLGRGLLVLSLDYAGRKSAIPTESYWFERVYEHADWFVADEIQVNFAVETGTGISPKEVPDRLWVERRLGETVRVILDPLLERDDLRGAARVTAELTGLLKAFASRGGLDEALLLWRSVGAVIWSSFEGRPLGLEQTPLPPHQAAVLALADADAIAPVEILLGLISWAQGLRGDSFAARIDRSMKSDDALYSVQAPPALLSLLEGLRRGVDFEAAAEGHVATPNWYPRHLAARSIIEFLDQSVDAILEETEKSVRDRAQTWIDREGGVISSVLLARGLETSHKLRAHIPRLERVVEYLSEFKTTDDQYWPTQDFSRHLDRVTVLEAALVRLLAGLLRQLAARPRDPSVTDFFGHAYTMVHDAAFEALVKGQSDTFKDLFPVLFDAAIMAFQRTHEALARHDQQARFVFSTEPIIDLLELSGYALVFSELDGLDVWEVVRGVWDVWLERNPNATSAIQFLHGVIEGRDSIFALPPRAASRSGRQQQLSFILRERGIVEETPFPGSRPAPPAHPSPIVRAFAPGDFGLGFMDEAEDLFYVEYLAKRDEAAGLELPGRARFVAEQIERERARAVDEGEPSGEET